MSKGKPQPTTGINYVGSKRGEVITGTEHADRIDGGGGDDRIYGYGGNDTLLGGDGNDQIFAGSGDDVVDGGPGSDVIYGQDGTDFLTGGSGADRFGWNYLSESRAGDGIDTITDWNPSEGDTLFVRPEQNWNGSWFRVHLGSDTGNANEFTLTYDPNTNTTVLNMFLADGIAGNGPDMTIHLLGHHTTSTGMLDFVDFFG